MDDFLLDAPKSNYACHSIEDLQLQFARLCEEKVTETRSEHISATYEFPSTVIFNIIENQNDGADANQNLDSAPAGSSGVISEAPPNENGGATPAPREIRAHDTIMNQPTDDPTLQKAVAKHIITCLGAVDGSAWTVRSLSRGPLGWTFQYLCKSSVQAWQRQNSKNPAKVLVGESSGKDGQDPINLARPAFDCRGTVTIAFAKNNRSITVKLEHTPLHKTVADLFERYKPPPLLARAEVVKRKEGEGRKRKTRPDQGDDGQNGEGGKRRKKKPPTPGEPRAEGQEPKPKKARKSRAKNPNGAGAQAQGEDQQNNALLNLSPTEAARRRDEAVRKLTENGIDATTLSTEQFDIFANQSPELQNESLAMLIKYGAERLRIVHPNKDNASSSPASANGATAEGSAKKKSRKKAFNEDGTPKVKKTRGGCQACRAKKMKCSKAKPECTECIEAGIACYYPPEQKRKHSKKSAETAEDEPQEPREEAPAPETVREPGPEPGQEILPDPAQKPVQEPALDEETSDLGSPGFNPQPSDIPTAFSDVAQDMYQPAATGLSYPQAVADSMSTGMDYPTYSTEAVQQQTASNGMAYPHQPQQTSSSTYPDPMGAHHAASVPKDMQPVQPTAQPKRPTSSRASARHSLPSRSGENHNGYSATANAGNATDWQMTNAPASTAQTFQSSPSRSSRSQNKASAPTYEASRHEKLQAAAALSQAALQNTQPSPTTRTVSPFQNPTQSARAKSRQGQRAQSRATASPFQQASSTQPTAVDGTAIYNTAAAADSQKLPNYDQYSRYNTATTQNKQASSRTAYEPYAQQQTTSNGSSASYPNFDAYASRPHASTSSSLAAPVTQTAPVSYKKTAAPSPNGWPDNTGNRNSSPYSTNNVAATSNSAYDMPASSTTQQQHAAMQSFNVRPQPTAHTKKTTTPSSYGAQQQIQQPAQQPAQQPRRQQQQQQQQSYNNYSSQSRGNSTQQQQYQQQHQQQQDWYGFGSSHHEGSGYGTNTQESGYGQPGTGTGSYNHNRAMNLSSNTYQSMNEPGLYEMLRNNPGH